MDKVLENLKKLSKEFYEQYRAVQDKIVEIVDIPLAKSLVGKCFVYMNGYGPNERWPMYVRVVSSKGTQLKLEIFEEDLYGKIEIEYAKQGYATQFQTNLYVPITSKEYFAFQKKLLDKLYRKYQRNKDK